MFDKFGELNEELPKPSKAPETAAVTEPEKEEEKPVARAQFSRQNLEKKRGFGG